VLAAEVLAELTALSRWERLWGRAPGWRVLHSVPLGDERGRVRGDIDRVLIGPSGVVTINTKHHRAGRLELDGDALVVNGREAERAAEFLRPALVEVGEPALAARLVVRPLIAVIGGRLLVRSWASGVTVVMPRQLVHALRAIPAGLDEAEVGTMFEVARRSTTWARARAVRPTVTGPPGGDASR